MSSRRLPTQAPDGASTGEADRPQGGAVPAAAEPGLLSNAGLRQVLVVQLLFWGSSATLLMLPKYLKVHLGAGPGWIGVIMGAMAFGSVAGAPLVGLAEHRWGRRICMVGACLLLAFGWSLFVAVSAVGPLAVVARIVQGIAAAIFTAQASVLVADLVPARRLPSAIALYMTAGLAGNLITPPLAEWWLDRGDPAWIFAGAAMLATAAAWMCSRLPDPRHVESPAGRPDARRRPRRRLLLVSALAGLAAGSIFTFYQPLALSRGIDRVSDFLITFTITAAALRLAGGRLIDRLGSRQVSRWALVGYAAVLFALVGLQEGQLWLYGILLGLTHGLFFPTFIALMLSGAGAGRNRAVHMAWMGAFDKVGFLMVIPLGLLAEHLGYVVLFIAISLSTAVAALVLSQATHQPKVP
ncbi:hypothetical protein LBMAG53_31970 [Planctomycetota bacterium]|nr:hypothetical protein LBMAG53_31970 [Planctomycetota bacterium]